MYIDIDLYMDKIWIYMDIYYAEDLDMIDDGLEIALFKVLDGVVTT